MACAECRKRNRPTDLFNKENYVDREIRDGRYDICLGCDRLFKPTKTCKECGCFMNRKTWLKDASCPISKWDVSP
jgi:rRNA maturation endonuclease Nob1